MQGEAEVTRKNSFMRILLALEGPQHLKYLGESLRGKYPYIRRRQIVTGMVLSIASIGLWLHFVIKSWRTLGAPLSTEPLPARSAASSAGVPPEALPVGNQLS